MRKYLNTLTTYQSYFAWAKFSFPKELNAITDFHRLYVANDFVVIDLRQGLVFLAMNQEHFFNRTKGLKRIF